MFTRGCVRVRVLPVKENPLADCRNGILCLVQRRQLRPQAVLRKGHDEISRVDTITTADKRSREHDHKQDALTMARAVYKLKCGYSVGNDC